MLLSIQGAESTGKTTLAYSAPLPIMGFSFDLGSERALYGSKYDELFKGLDIQIISYQSEEPARGADITIYEMPQPIQLNQEALTGFMEQWAYFIKLFSTAATNPAIKTIVIDTMTLARRIKADAYLQELQEGAKGRPRKQLLQIEYGHANDAIRNLYTLLGGIKKNLVAIHHETDERKDMVDKDGAVVSMITGNKILEGLTQTHRYVDIALLTEKEKGNIKSTFLKCGYSLGLEGTPIQNPTWDKIVDMVDMALDGRIKLERRA